MTGIGDVVARNVRAERARLGWTQRDLAGRLGWLQESVSALERGRRDVRLSDVPALCRALDVDLRQLLFGADEDDLRVMGL